MWYVIQVKSGNEHGLSALLEQILDRLLYRECFVPLYEEVWHRSYGSRIVLKRLFPGYVFVDTDYPEHVFRTLRRVPEFTRLLGAEEEDGTKLFIPVGAQDEEFLQTILEDGVMRVSYVHLSESNRIDKVVGPLAKYRNHITKMEYRHRFAIVRIEMFGKKREIRFGLWSDGDPKLPWLERRMEQAQEAALDEGIEIDIGLHPGDRVVDETKVYGDYVFTIDEVDAKHRTIRVKMDLLGGLRRIELYADDVRKVG